MKKLFISALFMLTAISFTFAGTTDKSFTFKGAENFKKTFRNASDIEVKTVGEYTSVKFNWNDQKCQAFYNTDGELTVTSRNIELNRLPLPALKTISEKYSDYTNTETIEFDHAEEGLSYYVCMENNERKIILKVDTYGYVSTFKNVKK